MPNMAVKLLIFIAFVLSGVSALQLVKVVIVGRHHMRAPLPANLEKVTPNVWPKWTDEPGFLTVKGRLLEGYMGEYFSQWLRKEGLFDECPIENSTLLYANAPQRTRETAKVFNEAAFKNCNLTVHYKKNVTMDPIFHPVIRNTSEILKQKIYEEMQKKLDELKIDDAYLKLNHILRLKSSRLCKEVKLCDLRKNKDVILFEIGEEPNINGSLSIANSVLDQFLMSFYNGTPLQDIGWGGIKPEDWEIITKVTKENQNVRFNSTVLASHVGLPLLHKISDIMSNDELIFALLVGHDSNITPLLTTLRFKPYELPNQYEKTPVGGKLVFQKWYDVEQDQYLLKVTYVYQTTYQLRFATRISLDTPPGSVDMELTDYVADKNGFYKWTDFLILINKFD